ncbi:electron transport complex subunit RsxC [Desulfococcus sp.]|uniref:electron transport complex subunit RsxC n=1 Tax=Desulfococcus sp. TaxID=2025834 RepID=UPI003593AECF
MGFNFKFFGSGGTFPHGVHPPERKAFAENAAIEVMPPPDKVVIPLLQNVGAPGKPSVKAKASVAMGDRIADAGGFVSAPIHSPIAGKVAKVGTTTLPNGRHVAAMPIKAEGEQLSGRDLWDENFGGDWPREGLARYGDKEIVDAIQNAGVVGLGGATFPTHVKYVPNDKKPIDTVMINGCECEPYLTSDYRMMIEAPEPIITGALLLGQVTHARDIIIGVEDNKPKAVEALQKAAAGTGIRIAVFKTKYPQGSEKQLILAATGRAVPLGGLPLDVGVAVSNVSTAAVVARAVLRGKPLTHRVVSVTGAGIRNPKNLLVPMGIRMGDLIDYCGGLTADAARIVAGGPMMGFAFSDMETPVTKGTSGITVLTHADLKREAETNCIRCGRCVDACPMNLVPSKLALASRKKDVDLAQMYSIMACFECGSCAYICPAQIPIVQLVRTGKAVVIGASKK